MKVYVVTSGTYSDYNIEAIFTDKEQADLYCERAKLVNGDYDSASVEEYDSDLPVLDTVEVLVMHYDKSDSTRSGERMSIRWRGLNVVPCRVLTAGAYILVEGSDHERVRKTYSEAVAQYVAMTPATGE